MTKSANKQLFCALVLLSPILVSGISVAGDYPLEEKLQQCEVAFQKMHSGELTQDETWQARSEHKKLVKEILEYLNKRNHEVLNSKDHTLSAEEILNNVVVIGSLLEMMATEDLRMTDEWGYPLSR